MLWLLCFVVLGLGILPQHCTIFSTAWLEPGFAESSLRVQGLALEI